MTKRCLILQPVFIIALFILLLNDFWLKQAFGNYFTGKLSDFSGLIVFPIFIAFSFPQSTKWISIATGILFVIWKTPATNPLIELVNQISTLKIQRVIDYSDYWALLVLPLSHRIINTKNETLYKNHFTFNLAKTCMASVSLFAICATSMPPPVEMPQGTVYIGNNYTIKKSKAEVIAMIKSLGYNVDYYKSENDSAKKYHISLPYYQTDNIIVYDDNLKAVDTIPNIKYTFYEQANNKTKIEIINVTLSNQGNIQKWQTLKHLRKQYKKILEKLFIKKVN